MDIIGGEKLAMKMGIIFVVGCAELSPSSGGRLLKFVFSGGAYWNDKELMYNAKLILSVLQIFKLLKYGILKMQGWKSRPHSFHWGKSLKKKNKIQIT